MLLPLGSCHGTPHCTRYTSLCTFGNNHGQGVLPDPGYGVIKLSPGTARSRQRATFEDIMRDQDSALASHDIVLQGDKPLIRGTSSMIACMVTSGTDHASSRLPKHPAAQELGSYRSLPYQATLTPKPRARKYASMASFG